MTLNESKFPLTRMPKAISLSNLSFILMAIRFMTQNDKIAIVARVFPPQMTLTILLIQIDLLQSC